MTKSKLASVVFGAFAALLLLIGVAEAYDGVSPDVEVAINDEAIGRKICIYRNGHKICFWRNWLQETEGVDQAVLEPVDGEEVVPTEGEEEFTFEAEEADKVVVEEDGAATEPIYFFRRLAKIKRVPRPVIKKMAPRL
jgi:hypothetical protein